MSLLICDELGHHDVPIPLCGRTSQEPKTHHVLHGATSQGLLIREVQVGLGGVVRHVG